MVLGKFPVLGRLNNLDNSRAKVHYASSMCGQDFLDIFSLVSVISLFFLRLTGGRPDID